MTKVSPPPINEPLTDLNNPVENAGIASIPWILFFNQIYKGDTGSTWTPTFTDLTIDGTPTVTGRYYKLIGSIVYFVVDITPATSTTSTSGTTYIDNFPLTIQGSGICFAVTNGTGSVSGMCAAANNRIYVPGWTTITTPLSVIGIVEAS